MTKQHRRTFITTVGLGTAALAGCTGSLDFGNGDEDDENGNGDENGEDPAPDDDYEEQDVTAPAIASGDLIDDFEESEWFPLNEEHTTVERSDDALVGDHALRVESDDEDESAGAYRVFRDGLDIEGQHLSLAVKVESPLPARVVLEARAPGRSDTLESARSIPGEFDGWLRMEAGWTGEVGEPDLSDIRELRIYVVSRQGAEGSASFMIDDLRATESADQGYAVLTFDDSVASQYTTAYPMLEERGWPGVAAIIPSSLNRQNRLTTEQCRELRDAGWDISSHPHSALPEFDSSEERIEYLERERDYIANRIDEEGAQHYFVPYNRMDAESIEDVREVFETSYIFGGQPGVAPPAEGHMISRVNGHDASALSEMFDLAAKYNQTVVTMVHGVGDGDLDDVTEEEFEALLDEIDGHDLDVVTVSELLDA
ncbi:MAG: polysaccharide deacetylase family protein [Euryarchaeota archaeon]|nr:polysaccharide deacetylase family protein [Euryarchaeota archaeon]